MGLFVKQDESRSELQQKIAADLEARRRAGARTDDDPLDGVEDSRFVEGTGRASRLGFAVIILFVIFIIATIVIVSLPR